METINVLLVDDEQDYSATLAERLMDKGLNVLSASDGREAIQIIKRMHIDVIAMDIVMPGMSGIGTLREIKKQYPDSKVIMLTGLSDVGVTVEAMHLGAYSYLIKPVNVDRLFDRIQDAYRKRQLKQVQDEAICKASEKEENVQKAANRFSWVSHALNRILFKRQIPVENIEALRAGFKVQYQNFKLLLKANNRALELMSEIEESLSGTRPFGMNFVRSQCSRIAANVYQIIRNLNRIKPGKYTQLFEKFDSIQKEILPLLYISSHDEQYPFVASLKGINKSVVHQVGGKMANLGELKTSLGLDIPESFVITARSFRLFMNHNSLQTDIEKTIQSMESEEDDYLYGLSEVIHDMILKAPLPEKLEEAILGEYEKLEKIYGTDFPTAVRSSSPIEDLPGMSVAGQYRSELGVTSKDIILAYKKVVASKYSYQSMVFRMNLGIRDDDVTMCVGVMPMVECAAGGVVYTKDPVSPDNHHMTIYSLFGQPKLVVDGSAETDRFVVTDRQPIQILEKNIVVKKEMAASSTDGKGVIKKLDETIANKPSLDDEKILELADIASKIEKHYESPQDIEWAISLEGKFTILQNRPLTRRLGSDPEMDTDEDQNSENIIIHDGITASPGIASGPVFLMPTEKEIVNFPKGGILVTYQALPVWAAVLGRAKALITQRGNVAGHLASVARDYGTPALFGVKDAMITLTSGQQVTVDADRKKVYDGDVGISEEPLALPISHIKGSPVYESLSNVSKHILPLHLLDPDEPGFSIDNCSTVHDITRFCHEKAVRAMFTFGKEHRFPERSGRQLFVDVPMKYWIIDLDNGFSEAGKEEKKYIHLENIRSIPMLSIWRGMTAIDWGGPPMINPKGFLSAMYESTTDPTIITTARSQQYTRRSYFMITKNFVSFQLRIGYHFCTAEALLGDRNLQNYISFVFTGGAAGYDNIARRARLIADILEEQGFHTRVVKDTMTARLEGAQNRLVEHCLEIIGYLIIHTRQLDMALKSKSSAVLYKNKIRADIKLLKEKRDKREE